MPDEKDPDAPSLELPSFRFGRRRTEGRAATDGGSETPEVAPRLPVPDDDPRPGSGEDTPTRTVPVTSPEPSPAPEPAPTDTAASMAALPAPVPVEPRAAVVTAQAERADPAPEPRTEPLLGLGALRASLLTGLVVGALTALLGYGSQRLCEGVRGTSSCGGPGVLVLLAILVVMVLLGSSLLRLALVPEPTSTSVLAVALLTVLVLLFLIDAAFSPAMFVVVPLLAAGCYAVAHWVTTTAGSSVP